MSPTEHVQAALEAAGIAAAVVEYPAGTGTAQDAADAVGCELGQIVKTLFFLADGRPTVALVAGDRQADTAKLAAIAGVGRKKLRMGTPDEVLGLTGYAVGGVSPVGLAAPCDIVVDESLQRFERVWAAAGTSNAVFGAPVRDLVAKVGGQWAPITKE
ncbi:MAG: YbaK/EbsC family protein [Dehalococcoidia bacterium]